LENERRRALPNKRRRDGWLWWCLWQHPFTGFENVVFVRHFIAGLFLGGFGFEKTFRQRADHHGDQNDDLKVVKNPVHGIEWWEEKTESFFDRTEAKRR
jgi:hypothetical protein